MKKQFQTKGRRLQYETLEDRLALTVVISEFLAENNTGIEDTAGHRHDWIELKNVGVSTEDISGWYLTDDALNLTKWQLPSTDLTTSLAAGETLLVFASGANGEVGAVGDELHANFQLSQERGYLGLVLPNGSTIANEFNLYPQQTPDVSYALGVGVGSTTVETLLTAGSSATGDGSLAQFRPFTGPNVSVDDQWTEIDYVANAGDGWINTTDGLGYGYSSPWQDSTVSLDGEIAGYVRMPFDVTNAAGLTSLSLDLRVDNGYIVYLNGREVGRERLPTTFKIGNDWFDSNDGNGGLNARQNIANSTITGAPAIFDLTPWLDTIEEGDNVLAIYAANHTSDTGDYLVHAELTAERASGVVANTFMVAPTPNSDNGAGYLGVITDTVFSHRRGFYDGPFDLTIAAVGPASISEPGATIRYTIDGTRPSLTNGTTYTGPLTIDTATLSYTNAGAVTVRAAAFKSGHFPSNVDTQTYIFLDDVLSQDGAGLPTFSSWGHAGADWEVDPNIVSAIGAENLKADLQSIPTMSLVMDWEELFGNGSGGDGNGIYTHTDRWRNKSDERFASLEYFTSDLTEEFQIDSVVEIQGHSSTNRWRSDKLSLEVKFKQPYDTKLESDSLFGNSVVDGENAANDFDSLILDAQYNYTFAVNNTTSQGPYATYVHDQVVADLQNLAGGEAAHGRWVHLYINGLYWGIYNAHERPTDSFAEEYYGGDKDDYLVVKGFEGKNLAHGGTQDKYLQNDGGLAAQIDYEALLDEVADNLANLSEFNEVADVLDIDAFVDYMIVHFYAGNYDWGELNWFASKNGVDPDGKWRFHAWDQEHAFPNDQNAPAGDGRNQDYDQTELVANDFGEHEFGPTGIHHQLMGSEEYRLRFSDRVQELMRNDGLLTPANAQAVWQARVEEISAAINGEAARWGDNRSPDKDGDTWSTNVQYTADNFFFANGSYDSRTDIVIDIFNSTISSGVGKIDWLVDLDTPTFSQYGGEIAAPFDLTLTNANAGGTIYYTTDGSDPRAAGGAISGAAVAYTGGAINLTESTRVRARVLDADQSGSANAWSAEVDKTFLLADRIPLRVVELMYNPAGADATEYIELLNIGTQPIDLTGVQLTDFSTGGYTFSGGTLAAGERIVVAEDLASFQSQYPTVTNVAATSFSGNLSNGGETVTLVDSFGTVLQSFTYDDETPWPNEPDNGGPSLEYVGTLTGEEDPKNTSPADPFDDPTNWQASASVGGSPGTDGTGFNNDPVITSDGGGDTAELFVPEGLTAVTMVAATDSDSPPQTLTFSIVGGIDAGHFGIVGSTGELTFNSAPVLSSPTDDNLDGVYVVEVAVDDGNGGEDKQTINVTITGQNQAPEITSDGGGSTANISLDENVASVTTISATDSDLPQQSLTYSVTGGADASLFSVGSASGELTFNAAPNFEGPTDSGANNTYEVGVTVEDGFGGSDFQSLTITVGDVNDHPVITNGGGFSNATVQVAEGSTAVTTVVAIDEDGPPQTLTYSIVGGVDAGQFSIGPSSGVLTFLAGNDFESPDDANTDGVYQVDVQVVDGVGGADLQFIDVVLTDANDPPEITSNGGGAVASLDATEGQTSVTTVTASDPDFPGDVLAYAISGGVDAGHFSIGGSTGVLTFNSPPSVSAPTDNNLDGVYVVDVTVSDGNGGADVQTLNVTVIDLPSGDPSNLRIVELHYNPSSSPRHEFIELVNAGSTSLSLDGVEIDLNDGEQNYVFEGGQGLLPGERIVVVRDFAEFASFYNPSSNGVKVATGIGYDELPYDMSLSNTQETIKLYAPGSVVIQQFYYEDGTPWPSASDGSGPSVEYIGPLTLFENPFNGSPADPFDDPTNWQASSQIGGTPGTDGTLPGDYDSNGAVEQADYIVWRTTYGSTTDLRADGNGDDVVDAADYTVWRNNLADSLPAAAATQAVSTAAVLEASVASSLRTDESTDEAIVAEQTSADQLQLIQAAANRISDAGSIATSKSPMRLAAATATQDDLLLLLALDNATRESSSDTPRPVDLQHEQAVEDAFATLEYKVVIGTGSLNGRARLRV